ncbi:MAG TPA: uroporphyrinogen decarboxylase family protein [Thermotogota bacterium]|nr:uroporphyrinogen decarboxylase family protein [Thermotogota bacterium]
MGGQVLEEQFPGWEPNFALFRSVMMGEAAPLRVHLFEHEIDGPFRKKIWVGRWNLPWGESREQRIFQDIEFRRRMGYDFATLWGTYRNNPLFSPEGAEGRRWAQEGLGLIRSREDFEKWDWQAIRVDESVGEIYRALLPAGMKCLMCSPVWHKIMDDFLGHTGLFTAVIEQPDLVKDVIDAWGQKVFDFYATYIREDFVGGIFHGDDLGHKTGTLVRPSVIRALFLPWVKKYAALAHQEGKVFFLHSCGNVYALMEDFLQDIQIDAFHSFQDTIVPVTDFKKRYGKRTGVLGGVDVDKLARLPERELRAYLDSILETCMEGGRYALGSGNSITDYVPVSNYRIMIAQAVRFSESMGWRAPKGGTQ